MEPPYFQTWWWANPPQERSEDLNAAEKVYGDKHLNLGDAQQEILDEDPDHCAFISEYRRGEAGEEVLKKKHEDPREAILPNAPDPQFEVGDEVYWYSDHVEILEIKCSFSAKGDVRWTYLAELVDSGGRSWVSEDDLTE